MNNTKIIPNNIKDKVLLALSYYPKFDVVYIEFKIKKKSIKKSTMQARPTFDSFFKKKGIENT